MSPNRPDRDPYRLERFLSAQDLIYPQVVSELRAGHKDASGNFVNAPGGSLINDRAIDASIQELERLRWYSLSSESAAA